MKTDMTVEGVEETAHAVGSVRDELPTELETDLPDALHPIWVGLTTYPTRPKPSNYRRTFVYRSSVRVEARREGNVVTGQISYLDRGLFIRGDVTRGVAWMHVGIWEAARDMIQRLWPQIVARMQAGVDRMIVRWFPQ